MTICLLPSGLRRPPGQDRGPDFDVVLDAILAETWRGRVACETLVKTGVVIVARRGHHLCVGRRRSTGAQDGLDIGYTPRTWIRRRQLRRAPNLIGKQSPDIAQAGSQGRAQAGSGDQGLMFGYATNETDCADAAPDHTRPIGWSSAKAQVRKSGRLPWLTTGCEESGAHAAATRTTNRWVWRRWCCQPSTASEVSTRRCARR